MDIKEILKKHAAWLRNEKGGEKANLSFANLNYADLRGANLRGADLMGANLRGANLMDTNLMDTNLNYADLMGANLRGADLRGANLMDTNLNYADLMGANLNYADLRGANLMGADLRGAEKIEEAIWNSLTAFYPLQCPEVGAFIGWKKASDKIIKLEICEDAKRSSATSRKCRCSKAKVLAIENIDGTPFGGFVQSNYDNSFIYKVGETVSVDNFDENRWDECAVGIHFFITREEAVKY